MSWFTFGFKNKTNTFQSNISAILFFRLQQVHIFTWAVLHSKTQTNLIGPISLALSFDSFTHYLFVLLSALEQQPYSQRVAQGLFSRMDGCLQDILFLYFIYLFIHFARFGCGQHFLLNNLLVKLRQFYMTVTSPFCSGTSSVINIIFPKCCKTLHNWELHFWSHASSIQDGVGPNQKGYNYSCK